MSEVTVDARRMGQQETGDDERTRMGSLREGDMLYVRIFRFDPEVDEEPRYDSYEIPYERMMRVLDVLNYISEDLEEDLAYRWYCGVKKCGTCAVRMNGREILACWDSVEREMVIEPLRHVPLIRDLAVDREPYEKKVVELVPWLERAQPYKSFPERISHNDMKSAVTALDCLSCLACYSACPVLDLGDETNFAGPAPLVQFAQMALDPRDGMDRGALAIDQAGIFNCVSCYKCEEACPMGIPVVTEIIEPLKALAYKNNPAGSKHAAAFSRIIENRGRIDPSELVLRTQGLRATLNVVRILKLWFRGKINPRKTFFAGEIPGMKFVKRIFQQTRGD